MLVIYSIQLSVIMQLDSRSCNVLKLIYSGAK